MVTLRLDWRFPQCCVVHDASRAPTMGRKRSQLERRCDNQFARCGALLTKLISVRRSDRYVVRGPDSRFPAVGVP